ncbi:MAG: hypothetical protein QXR65_08750 [Candidatus Bathyarchaeia archaeon]
MNIDDAAEARGAGAFTAQLHEKPFASYTVMMTIILFKIYSIDYIGIFLG